MRYSVPTHVISVCNMSVFKWHSEFNLTYINTSQSFPHSWLITGFVIRLTRRVPLVEKELLTLPENLSSPSSLVVYVCFEDGCLFFCLFSFGHCDVWSLIYGFWLPLWYHQTLLTICVFTTYLRFTELSFKYKNISL